MTAKTPVSILNEYMFKMKQIPHFELVLDSAGHDTVFEYVVTVDKVTARGSGRSKKEAKHNAAQSALEELAKSNQFCRDLLLSCGVPSARSPVTDEDSSVASVTVSPYAEQVTENTIGALAAICAQHQLPSPDYKVVDESGPPHCKTFKIHCSIHSLVEVGISRTKKQAKHIAAKNMLDKIKEHLDKPSSSSLIGGPSEQRDLTNSRNHDIAVDRYCSIKEKERVGVIRENVSLNLATCHLNIKGLTGAQVDALKSKQIDGRPEDLLMMFAEEQNVSLTFAYLDAEGGQYVCAAALSTTPDLVQLGIGSDEDMARELASYYLLKALIIMLGEHDEE